MKPAALTLRIALLSLCSSTFIVTTGNAWAQLIPDNTLGEENSIVTPQILRDVIEGGAIRGDNLFHSFSEFNINEGQNVYFANPVGIFNILTRVTGTNPSDIFGTLGVDGGANLILINPNGINFGNNASLDISGSFFATTSESIIFDNGLEFSATNPEAPPLLTVNLTPGLQLGLPAQAAITNAGNLAVGQDFTLSGSNLFLSGQLQAGNNLTLQASDLIQIRDSLANPFIASAGNKLLVQGNQNIDIFALIHPDSGLFSGGNMILRSANPIAGDAHFASGGNFRVEQLDGNLGELFSSNNPTIRSNGDVFLDSFTGTSLHILAGGRVEIPGTISITGAAEVGEAIVESVALSDGTIIEIDGSAAPTVDIRAGTTAFGDAFVSTGVGTNADINVGDIIFNSIGSDGGTVLLTNQYQPNTNLSGDITVSSISTGDFLGGGLVAIDSRGGITINGIVNVSALADESGILLGDGGDVTLLAKGDIIFNPGASIISDGLLGGNISLNSNADISVREGAISSNTLTDVANTTGGDINVTGSSVFLSNGARISANTLGAGDAGSVIITATDSISFDGESSQGNLSGAFSTVESGAMGNGGNVEIITGSLELSNGAQIGANTSGQGDAGSVTIRAQDTISLTGESSEGNPSGAFSNVLAESVGNGGNVEIITGSLELSNGAEIGAGTFGQGNAGSITIRAQNTVSLTGVSSQGFPSGAFSTVQSEAIGNGGSVEIITGSLELSNGAQIVTSTLGQGNAGSITIRAQDTVSLTGVSSQGNLSGAFSTVQSEAIGNGGNVEIITGSLEISNGAFIDAATFGQGDAGSITIRAQDTVSLTGVSSQGFPRGAFSSVEPGAVGNGGNVEITTGLLNLANDAVIFAGSLGEGIAGNITIDTLELTVQGNSEISAFTESGTKAGNVTVNATEFVVLTENSSLSVAATAGGTAGDLIVTTEQLSVEKGSSITVSSPQGQAGNLDIISDNLLLNQSSLTAETGGGEDGANITLEIADFLFLDNQSSIIATANDAADGGNIIINAGFVIAPPSTGEGSDISANAVAGNGGLVSIATDGLFGITFKSANTSFNDITASSKTGAAGIVEIIQPNVDPAQSLAVLPGDLIDRTNSVVNSCGGGEESISRFVVTGRGGLPANPGEILRSNNILVDLVELESQTQEIGNREIWKHEDTETIVEAQGWVVNTEGKILLTAQTIASVDSSWLNGYRCGGDS